MCDWCPLSVLYHQNVSVIAAVYPSAERYLIVLLVGWLVGWSVL